MLLDGVGNSGHSTDLTTTTHCFILTQIFFSQSKQAETNYQKLLSHAESTKHLSQRKASLYNVSLDLSELESQFQTIHGKNIRERVGGKKRQTLVNK